MMQSLYRVRIKILTFVLILVSLGTINATTRTKYVSYVNAYSAAEAGDFYFGSNYLSPSNEHLSYTINNWDKSKYSVTIQIWNYENSLLYNSENVDFYYKVEAVMYEDEDSTIEDTDFFSTIVYEDGVPTIEVDGETYAYMEGIDSFDTTAGSQSVSVTMQSPYSAEDVRYMVITATSVPLIEGSVESVDDLGETTTETISISSYGVFESTLNAVFELQNISGTATVSTQLSQSDINSQVQLRITCPEIVGGTSQVLRIYYDPEVLEMASLDASTSSVSTYQTETGGYYYYSEITVNAQSVTTILLLKLHSGDVDLGTSLGTGDIFIEEVS